MVGTVDLIGRGIYELGVEDNRLEKVSGEGVIFIFMLPMSLTISPAYTGND